MPGLCCWRWLWAAFPGGSPGMGWSFITRRRKSRPCPRRAGCSRWCGVCSMCSMGLGAARVYLARAPRRPDAGGWGIFLLQLGFNFFLEHPLFRPGPLWAGPVVAACDAGADRGHDPACFPRWNSKAGPASDPLSFVGALCRLSQCRGLFPQFLTGLGPLGSGVLYWRKRPPAYEKTAL